MRNYLILIVLCLSMACTSCGISYHATGNHNVSQTEVLLTQKNYKVVGMVEGKSSQNYFFGIGGMSKKSLGESAMAEMFKNANLSGAQAVININISYKSKFILVYSGVTAIATGTIIEFVDSPEEIVSISPAEQKTLKETSALKLKNKKSAEEQASVRLYKLIYLKKRKNENSWNIIKEEDVKAKYEEVQRIADKWNAQTTEDTEYLCQIKR